MSVSNFQEYLSADHRACDQILGDLRQQVVAANWAAAKQALARVAHDLLAHFAAEEEVLFPAFEEASGLTNGPTRIMRMEHNEARYLIEDLEEAFAAQDQEAIRGHSEALLILLQQHNLKEENILYPMAIKAIGKQAAELGAKIAQRREAA